MNTEINEHSVTQPFFTQYERERERKKRKLLKQFPLNSIMFMSRDTEAEARVTQIWPSLKGQRKKKKKKKGGRAIAIDVLFFFFFFSRWRHRMRPTQFSAKVHTRVGRIIGRLKRRRNILGEKGDEKTSREQLILQRLT